MHTSSRAPQAAYTGPIRAPSLAGADGGVAEHHVCHQALGLQISEELQRRAPGAWRKEAAAVDLPQSVRFVLRGQIVFDSFLGKPQGNQAKDSGMCVHSNVKGKGVPMNPE